MPDSSAWLLDSGASHHMTSDLSNLSSHHPYHGGNDVLLGDGSALSITHSGSSSFPSYSRPFFINDILCVPSLDKNLISVFQLCKANNVAVTFTPTFFQVKDLLTGELRLQGKPTNGTYEWPKLAVKPSLAFASTVKTSLTDWHSRLGHPALPILQKIISMFSLPVSSKTILPTPCVACGSNKMHKLSFGDSSISSSSPLEFIFSDVWTSPILSFDCFKYYVIFVDHFTRYTWFYPLKKKSDVLPVFVKFKSLVENRFGSKIKTLFSDNGGEYVALRNFLASHGISHMTSPPHTPEHNGLAERRHRHIVETGLALLSHASMPRNFWSFAFAAAVYLINRMPNRAIDFQLPYQTLFGQQPNLQRLRVFGCLCFPWLKPYTNNKLDEKSSPCVFLGYSLSQSAYFCLDRSNDRIYVSRHVTFHEAIFPFSKPVSSLESPEELTETSNNFSVPLVSVSSQVHHHSVPAATIASPPPVTAPPSPPITAPSSSPVASASPSSDAPVSSASPTPVSTSSLPSSSSSAPSMAASAPSMEASVSAQTSSSTGSPISVSSSPQLSSHALPPAQPVPPAQPPAPPAPPVQPPVLRRSTRQPKPPQKLNLHASLTVSPEYIPTSVNEALKIPHWRQAMNEEIDSQTRNHTWDLVNTDNVSNVVGSRWIFTIKRKQDGSINRYKARLVAKGYTQREGLDYQETYSPVVKPATIRLVLSLAVTNNWSLRQLDVNNAFLQGNLEEEVYMTQPTGFQDKNNPHALCLLRKAIYGLKQAPRAWYNELKSFLLHYGFQNSLADASLFIYNQNGVRLYMLVYVDDIIVTGNDPQHISRFIDSLSHTFSLKDLGLLSFFLGIEVTRNSHGIRLTQSRYISDLLRKTRMDNVKPVHTPMCTSETLTLHTGTTLDDASEYRMVLGSLQYLSLTRPDIAFAVNKLSQFMHKPTTVHWTAVKRILRYLSGTMKLGIFLSASSTPTLHAFTDADWAGNKDDYTSTSAYIVYFGQHPIAWTSKKQTGVARSSTEAEYRALASTMAEICWIASLIKELGLSLVSPCPTIYCDNLGATYLAANPVFHSRMKHIALDYHFVRHFVQHGLVRVSHVSSADQLADALTKPLPRTRFEFLSSKIGLSSPRPS